MIKGTIKFFNAAKGFGFITADDDGKDVFLPGSSIPAADAKRLKPGQRVTFEREADVKGPKAVTLTMLDEAPVIVAKVAPKVVAAPAPALRPSITLFYDPAAPEADEVLEALRAAGHEPVLVDYVATKPSFDELKRLSLLLAESDQSLVRRYHPLFLALQLDDRFIGESEFWTAVAEHPVLINGPLLVSANKVRVCRTEEGVDAFLGRGGAVETSNRPKGMSPRMLAMMNGEAVPPAPVRESRPVDAAPPEVAPKVKLEVRARPKPEPEPEMEPEPEPELEPKARKVVAAKKVAVKAPAKTAAKPAAKAKITVAKKKKA